MTISPSPIGFVETDRAYRLRRSEPVSDGIRRIVRGQLEDTQEELSGAPERGLGEAIHGTRKSLKRLRACMRLSRDAVGQQTYRRENTVFRLAGQQLSTVRDAQVLVDTLSSLERRLGGELPQSSLSGVRARLEGDRELALDPLRDDERTIDALRGELESARVRTAEWTFDSDGFDALRPGLRRVYRRGRKRLRPRARTRPSRTCMSCESA